MIEEAMKVLLKGFLLVLFLLYLMYELLSVYVNLDLGDL